MLKVRLIWAAVAACACFTTHADEITPAVLAAPSREGYMRTETGVQRIQYDVVGGRAMVEGDIVLGTVDSEQGLKGLIVKSPAKLWSGRAMPYSIDPALQNKQRITVAINHWRERTGIEFVERTSANASAYPNFVYFTNPKNDVCASMVGMQGGRQLIELADGCDLGATIHEIGHALGLAHEHTRSDRDGYVQVRLDRVVAGKEHNFRIRSDIYSDAGGYDYQSIMHYGPYAFSRTAGQPTIIALGGQPIGQRTNLSEGDVAAALRLYPRPVGKPVCVTLLMLNQPFWEGIGDIDTTVMVGGTRVFEGVLPYRGPYGHPPFELAKFWAPKGRHLVTVTSTRGRASLSTDLPIANDTTAVRVMFWGQRNGRPHRSFTAAAENAYDDIDDPIDCTAGSPTVRATTSSLLPDKSTIPIDARAPLPNWPSSDSAVQTFDRLEVPAKGIHKVPLGVTEYRVKELVLGDEAVIWFPYDKIRFTLSAERSEIGDKVQIKASGGEGRTGEDGPHIGAAGRDGGPGSNAPTLILELGQARVGRKFRVYLQGGMGGTGGAGAQGRTGFGAKCIPPESAKRGGNGGPGGFAGPAGAGGFLYLRGQVTAPLEGFRAFLNGGRSEYGGVGGPAGRGGRGRICLGFRYGPGSDGSPGASRSADAAGRVQGVEGRIFDELQVVPIGLQQ